MAEIVLLVVQYSLSIEQPPPPVGLVVFNCLQQLSQFNDPHGTNTNQSRVMLRFTWYTSHGTGKQSLSVGQFIVQHTLSLLHGHWEIA